MKVNRFKRMRPRPLDGLTFSHAENREASTIANALRAFTIEDITVLSDGLTGEIDRLEAASAWTESGTGLDDARVYQLTRARLLCRALEMARARID